ENPVLFEDGAGDIVVKMTAHPVKFREVLGAHFRKIVELTEKFSTIDSYLQHDGEVAHKSLSSLTDVHAEAVKSLETQFNESLTSCFFDGHSVVHEVAHYRILLQRFGGLERQLRKMRGVCFDMVNKLHEIVMTCNEATRQALLDKIGVPSVPRETTSSGPITDFDASLKHTLSLVVHVEDLNSDDMDVVGEALMQGLQVFTSRECMGLFAKSVIKHGVNGKLLDPKHVVDAIEASDPVKSMIWEAPVGLDPDAINKLPDKSSAKIEGFLALNRLMVKRVFALQTSEMKKRWLREGIEPIPCSSNERDLFFELGRFVKLSVTKPELRACFTWIKTHLPNEYKRIVDEDDQHLKRKGPDAPLNDAAAASSSDPSPMTPGAKKPKVAGFDISTCSFETFQTDAREMKSFFPDEASFVGVKDASRLKPFDGNAKVKEEIVNFEVALERLATQNLGLKCDKRSLEDLRRWIARALQVKYEGKDEVEAATARACAAH
ncbi:unnamed protein product, partial [Polarella glacialis]